MQPLNEMKLGHRIALTFVIVLIILFALAAFGYFTGGWEAQGETRLQQAIRQEEVQIYDGIPPDAQLIQLDRIALREAYHDYVKGLWNVWLKGQAGDPTYFKNGLIIARRAYAQALTQISRRESEIMEQEQRK